LIHTANDSALVYVCAEHSDPAGDDLAEMKVRAALKGTDWEDVVRLHQSGRFTDDEIIDRYWGRLRWKPTSSESLIFHETRPCPGSGKRTIVALDVEGTPSEAMCPACHHFYLSTALGTLPLAPEHTTDRLSW